MFCISRVLQQLADQFHLVASQKHDPCLPPVFVPRGDVHNCDDDDDDGDQLIMKKVIMMMMIVFVAMMIISTRSFQV